MLYLRTLFREENICIVFELNQGYRGVKISQINMDMRRCYDKTPGSEIRLF